MPVRHTFIADTETPVSAYLKLRGERPVVPARVGRAGHALRALVVPGLPPADHDPDRRRRADRRRRGARASPTRTRSWRWSWSATGPRRWRGCRRSPAAPWACSATTSCASPSRSVGEANPDPLDMPDMALMVSDVMVAFDHLRHEATILANVFVDGDVDDAYAVGGGRDRRGARAAGGARAPVRQRGERPPLEFESNTGERGLRGRRWRGAWSTSTPATPTRWCPASAGAPRRRWTRSRSTAACAR